jgi:hypothetical protein
LIIRRPSSSIVRHPSAFAANPLIRERQQGHIPGALDSPFRLALTTGTVAAALARVYLAAIRQELLERFNILVVNVFHATPAKTALRLLACAREAAFMSITGFATFFLWTSLHFFHLLPLIIDN